MSSRNENAVYDVVEPYNEGLSIEDIEASLNAELELELSDLSLLEDEREKIGDPDNLGKVIMDEVWTQFGNQIGLDMTNETLIQAYNREHPEKYSKAIGDAIMQDERYKEANRKMKQQHQDGTLTNSYTGKKLDASTKPNLDHGVPRKELYENDRRKQAGIDTKDLANKKENLAPTSESLNKSKREKSAKQYIEERNQREASLRKQNEAAHKKINESNMSEAEKRTAHEKADKRMQDKLDLNSELMAKQDAAARKAINKDIAKGVAKKTAQKAGKDALKIMAVNALFDLLKSIMNGLIRFFKEKHKSFKYFLTEMKESIKKFISHIASFIRSGVSSFVGTVVSEIFGPIVSMFKKLASLIKQGFSSLIDVIHYWGAKENKNKSLSVKIAEIGKLVTAGVVAVGAIGLSEVIEKLLLNIPVMAVEIPALGSLANITGIFLASLICGIIGAIVINRINCYMEKRLKRDNLKKQIDKKNEVLQTQTELIAVRVQKVSNCKTEAFQTIKNNHEQAKLIIDDALNTIFYDDNNDNNDEKLNYTAQKLKDLLN